VILGLFLGIYIPLPGGGYFSLATLGVWIFTLSVLFQIVTLPVEFNASGRALRMLGDYGIMGSDELDDCKKVLGAAALTYVAAAASAILQLLRLMLLSGRRRRND
jgi:Zn-dependent membrane protease YugP